MALEPVREVALEPVREPVPEPARAPVHEPSREPAPAADGHPDSAGRHLAACVKAEEVAGLAPLDVFPLPENPFPDGRLRDEALREGSDTGSEAGSDTGPTAGPVRGAGRPDTGEVLRVTALAKTFPLLKGAVFKRRVGSVYAVDGVDLDIRQARTPAPPGGHGAPGSELLRPTGHGDRSFRRSFDDLFRLGAVVPAGRRRAHDHQSNLRPVRAPHRRILVVLTPS